MSSSREALLAKLEKWFSARAGWLPYVAYNTLFWLAFWLFCYWTFPYDRVATYLVDRVAQSGRGYSLEIGELHPYWLSGVELTNVVLRKEASEPLPVASTDKKEKAQETAFRIPEARARVGIFSLLFGGKSLNFDFALDGGEIDGTFQDDADQKYVKASIKDVDLAKLGLFDTLLSLPVQGTLRGDVELTLHRDPKQTSGTLDINLDKLTVGDGKAKVKLGGMGGLTLDPLEAGTLKLEMDVKEGVGTIKRISTDGKDLVLKGSGEMRFAEPIMNTRVSVLLNIRFTNNYRNKSPRTQAMFSLLDNSGSPQLLAAKTPDGALQYRLAGTLGLLRPVPEGGSATAAPRPVPMPRAPAPSDDEE
jgi:type II secretion system protein N